MKSNSIRGRGPRESSCSRYGFNADIAALDGPSAAAFQIILLAMTPGSAQDFLRAALRAIHLRRDRACAGGFCRIVLRGPAIIDQGAECTIDANAKENRSACLRPFLNAPMLFRSSAHGI